MGMLDYLPALGSLLSYGSMGPASKKAINAVGRHRAIAYIYLVLVVLLVLGALFGNLAITFPAGLLPAYAAQVAIGAIGAIAAYKALDYGKASITSPLGKVDTVLVLMMSIVLLGEAPGTLQVAGALVMVCAALIIARDEGGKLRMEPWMPYLGLSIICRSYYYTFIKTFVEALGPYQATLFLELGIVAFVVSFHALRGRDLAPPPPSRAVFVIGAGFLFFGGTLLYSISVGAIGAALTSAVYSGAPIINAVVSRILLGEKLDAAKYAAIALMVLGLFLIVV
jgi:drug/metabolite transporter (DMT)-like permease